MPVLHYYWNYILLSCLSSEVLEAKSETAGPDAHAVVLLNVYKKWGRGVNSGTKNETLIRMKAIVKE